jgi:ABC-type lipoprotein release transport system permease subunit
MSLYTKLAWRNIFRNKRRTYITGTAIAIGLAALIFLDALYIGMANNMIASATASFTGEGQIHARDFIETQDANKTISALDKVESELGRDSRVKAFTARTLSQGMMTSTSNVNPVLLVGVRPETEKDLSQVDDVITQGAFFSGNDPQNIVIGSRLADLLEVGLGDRVVVTVAQAGSGELAQDLFRVSGIYHFNIQDLDGGLAFVRIEKAQAMLGLDHRANEIALTFKDPRLSRDEASPFWAEYSTDGNEALGWTRLFPALKSVYDLTQIATFIVGVILFAVVALGIINTLFMSIYERMFEFGVMRAVGTRPWGIRKLVVQEAGALAVLSIGLGIALGLVLTAVVSRTGINYRGVEFAGVTIRNLIYPVLRVRQFILYPLCVLVFTLLVGLYPAAYAARMSVTGAMKRTL